MTNIEKTNDVLDYFEKPSEEILYDFYEDRYCYLTNCTDKPKGPIANDFTFSTIRFKMSLDD